MVVGVCQSNQNNPSHISNSHSIALPGLVELWRWWGYIVGMNSHEHSSSSVLLYPSYAPQFLGFKGPSLTRLPNFMRMSCFFYVILLGFFALPNSLVMSQQSHKIYSDIVPASPAWFRAGPPSLVPYSFSLSNTSPSHVAAAHCKFNGPPMADTLGFTNCSDLRNQACVIHPPVYSKSPMPRKHFCMSDAHRHR